MISERQELVDRILSGGEDEYFTLIVIGVPPELIGMARIGILSSLDLKFMKRSIEYAHDTFCKREKK